MRSRRMRRVHLACASAAIGIMPMCLVDQLRGADRSWIDPGGGDFGTPGNWSPAVVPGAADAALFRLNEAYTVSFGANRTNDRMRLTQGTVTFDLGGRTYALTSTGLPTNPSIAVGVASGFPVTFPGHLLINNGTLSGSSALVGVGTAGITSRIDNRISVGAGGWLNATGTLAGGFETDGVIEVSGGGDVNANVTALGWVTGVRGGMSVSGGTSSFMTTMVFAGLGGHGTLNVSADADITTSIGASIANGTPSSGAVTVTGAGSSWTNTGTVMTVGTAGAGSLTISDGGLVTSGAPRIGDEAGATGFVSVNDARWNAPGTGAKIGNLGRGTLAIVNGGTVSMGPVEVGAEAGAAGTVSISGTGSRWTAGIVSVGKTGTGRIDVTSGGFFDSFNFVRLGGALFSTGTGTGVMNVDGAGSRFDGGLNVEETSTLTLSNGGHANLDFLENYGTVTVTGGTGSFGTVTSQFGGYGAGRINVTNGGSFTAQSIKQSVLNITGNGRATVRPDGTDAAVSVVQNLALGGSPGAWEGTLDLSDNDLVIDYDLNSPLLNVANQIRTAYNGGAWDGAAGITSGNADATNFALGFTESSALFTTFPATFSGQSVDDTAVLVKFTRYGDANLDGTVNLQDFNTLATNFGQANRFWRQGDFNYDGNVNLQDFNKLAANFGLSAAGPDVTPDDWAALTSAVPEPALGASLVTLALALGRARRRQQLRVG